ncbi:MAG: SIMPL domain-containing protein [Thaumarchaeota archaeon]|nr:SIMPL domain-containing protein [Nitrososphaerota archaeon]
MTQGSSRLVGVMLVVVIALAASTTYFGYLYLQSRPTGNNGSSDLEQGIFVSSLPGAGITLGSTQASNGATGYSITVTGVGQVTYSPNEALLSVSVVSNAATAGNATSKNAETTANVINALNSIGIGNDSIQTQGFYLYANYGNNYGSNIPPIIIGYTVTNSLLVNITASSNAQLGQRAGQAIDTAVAAGANQVSLQFAASTSLLVHVSKLALQAAVVSASDQAQTMAKSLGVNITGVISAVQGSSGYYPQGPYYYAPRGLAVYASTPIIPGSQSNSVSVTVVYAID